MRLIGLQICIFIGVFSGACRPDAPDIYCRDDPHRFGKYCSRSEFNSGLHVGEREEPSPGLVVPDGCPEDGEHRTLDEF